MRRASLMTPLAALAVVAAVVTPAAPARAAGELVLSTDGVAFAPQLPAPLFATVPVLVPREEAAASFWVRNDSTDDAVLTVSLDEVSATDPVFAGALTVTASAAGGAARVATADGSGCPVVLTGAPVAAGQAVEVTTTLALGDLTGTAGQGADLAMDLAVRLDDAAGGVSDPCTIPGPGPAVPGVVVVVVPSEAGAGAVAGRGGAAGTPEATEGAAGEERPSRRLFDAIDPLASLLPNTLSSFDAIVVLIAAAGLPLGAIFFLLIGLRRRQHDEDEEVAS